MSAHKLSLTRIPAAGHVHIDGGQTYTVKAAKPHKARDGRQTAIITWTSSCRHPGCGAPFDQTTGFLVRYWRRFCDTHTGQGFGAKPVATDAAAAPGHVGVSLVELAERVKRLETLMASVVQGFKPEPAKPCALFDPLPEPEEAEVTATDLFGASPEGFRVVAVKRAFYFKSASPPHASASVTLDDGRSAEIKIDAIGVLSAQSLSTDEDADPEPIDKALFVDHHAEAWALVEKQLLRGVS